MAVNGRALILVPADSMGGAERVLVAVSSELLMRDWEVDILCLKSGTADLFRGLISERCRVFHLSSKRELYGFFLAFFFFIRRIWRKPYELAFSSHVHCNGFLGFLRLVRLLRVRKLVCRESTVIARRFSGVRLLFYRFCYLFYGSVDEVICQTGDMRSALRDFLPSLPADKVNVVPNPGPVVSIQRPPLRDRFGPRIVAVGRLIPEKAIGLLVEAFHVVRFAYPAATLTVYGEGPCRRSIEDQVEGLGLTNAVALPGMTKAPLSVMAAADVCVVSSLVEGFPNTLLEMMAVNHRVVTTLCAGDIEQIRGLVTCMPGDSAALADAICRALQQSAEGRADLFDVEIERRSPTKFVDALLGVRDRADDSLAEGKV